MAASSCPRGVAPRTELEMEPEPETHMLVSRLKIKKRNAADIDSAILGVLSSN
jgi:hypothetical protein